MLKEIMICILIVGVIAGLDFITQNFTKDSVELLIGELEKIEEGILNENGNIEELTEYMMKQWKERKKALEYYIEHDELEKVETDLNAMIGNINVRDYEQSIPEIKKTIFVLHHIKEKFALKIQNIF